MNIESLRKVKFDKLASGYYTMFDTEDDPNAEIRDGYFHRWGDVVRWNAQEEKSIIMTVGIIEDENGSIHEVAPNRITFCEPINQE